jgi:hypothetical protein
MYGERVIDTKDAYYFPHDSNARNDEKCMYIIGKYGMAGYGLYWIFVECMHEQADGKLTCALLDGFAVRFNTDITLLKQFYSDAISTGLFVTDGTKYWSERVLRNKLEFEEKRSKKSIAGQKGMLKRWNKSSTDNSVITTLYQSANNDITKDNKVKESKVKESKENKNIYTLKPPTLEEVKAYCLERNKGVNPQKWYDHYTSNGWMVGKTKMKDWKAAVRTWEPDEKPKEQSKYQDMSNYYKDTGNPFLDKLKEMQNEQD